MKTTVLNIVAALSVVAASSNIIPQSAQADVVDQFTLDNVTVSIPTSPSSTMTILGTFDLDVTTGNTMSVNVTTANAFIGDFTFTEGSHNTPLTQVAFFDNSDGAELVPNFALQLDTATLLGVNSLEPQSNGRNSGIFLLASNYPFLVVTGDIVLTNILDITFPPPPITPLPATLPLFASALFMALAEALQG